MIGINGPSPNWDASTACTNASDRPPACCERCGCGKPNCRPKSKRFTRPPKISCSPERGGIWGFAKVGWTNVYIGDRRLGPAKARFIPPPWESVPDAIADLEKFVNSPSDVIPPLFVVALTHYQFETIHPFADGNGRIGRVLISRSLVKEGLLDHPVVYMSAYINEHKRDYVDLLLQISQRGNQAWSVCLRCRRSTWRKSPSNSPSPAPPRRATSDVWKSWGSSKNIPDAAAAATGPRRVSSR